METTAIDFHDGEGVFDSIESFTGTACWAELRDQDLFGSHRVFLQMIAKGYNTEF